MPQLRVATFNIAGGHQPDVAAINRLFTAENLDIIGVQEIDRQTIRNPGDMPAQIADPNYHFEFAKAIDLMGGEYGIAIFSRRPLHQVYIHSYTVYGEERRVFQHGVYDVADNQLSVYNTHLSFETPALRQQQVAELLDAVKADPVPHKVILGDFNMDQDHVEWDSLGPDLHRVNGDHEWYDTFTWRDATMKVYAIDNIIVTPNVRVAHTKMATQILSDHQMLETELDWT